MGSDNVLITAADSKYFLSLLSLIRSLNLGDNAKYPLYIFNLGLKSWEEKFLKSVIPDHYKYLQLPFDNIFDGWNSPRTRDNYAWKPRVIDEVISRETNFIWIDSGALVCASLKPVFNEIERSGHFLIRNYQHMNREWTSASCVSEMQASKHELDSHQVMGTFFGFALRNDRSAELYDSWTKWCRNVNAIKGDRQNHRHDQTILSILASRAKVELLDPEQFMNIGRTHYDYINARKLEITFLSHRNWIYLREDFVDIHSDRKAWILFCRSFDRHIFRWKLHLVYWARWTSAGSFYVSTRKKVKKLCKAK